MHTGIKLLMFHDSRGPHLIRYTLHRTQTALNSFSVDCGLLGCYSPVGDYWLLHLQNCMVSQYKRRQLAFLPPWKRQIASAYCALRFAKCVRVVLCGIFCEWSVKSQLGLNVWFFLREEQEEVTRLFDTQKLFLWFNFATIGVLNRAFRDERHFEIWGSYCGEVPIFGTTNNTAHCHNLQDCNLSVTF
jgi:hypothetical protein